MQSVRDKIRAADPSVEFDNVAWTKRSNTFLRGLQSQAQSDNFLHNVINLRAVDHAVKYNLPHALPEVPRNLLVNTRQNVCRQDPEGTITLLSHSVPYWYAGDRTLVCEEHMFLMGYDDDLNLDGIHMPIATKKVCDEHVAKRRRIRSCGSGPHPYHNKVVDIAGNGMVVPELMALCYAAQLAADNNMFECRPPPAPQNLDEVVSEHVTVLEYGADFDAHFRRAARADGDGVDGED